MTPGRIATKLQPDAHCSRSCAVRRSPPQKIGAIGMPQAVSAAKMFGALVERRLALVPVQHRQPLRPDEVRRKDDAQLAIDLREDHVEMDRRVLLRHHDDDDCRVTLGLLEEQDSRADRSPPGSSAR